MVAYPADPVIVCDPDMIIDPADAVDIPMPVPAANILDVEGAPAADPDRT